MEKLKTALRCPDTEFKFISDQIFNLEVRFPLGHPVRDELYKTRCQLGRAQFANRKDRNRPAQDWEYDEESYEQATSKET